MESFSQSVIVTLEAIPVASQMVVLGFFSFAEGLPVIGSIIPGGTIAIFAGGLSSKASLHRSPHLYS